jgi:hypothetical protein
MVWKPSFWRTGGARLMPPDPGERQGRARPSCWRREGPNWVMDGRAAATGPPAAGADSAKALVKKGATAVSDNVGRRGCWWAVCSECGLIGK